MLTASCPAQAAVIKTSGRKRRSAPINETQTHYVPITSASAKKAVRTDHQREIAKRQKRGETLSVR